MKDGDIVVARVRGESVYFVGKLYDTGNIVRLEDTFILLLQITQQGMAASLMADPIFDSFDFSPHDITQLKKVDTKLEASYLQAIQQKIAQKSGLSLVQKSPLR